MIILEVILPFFRLPETQDKVFLFLEPFLAKLGRYQSRKILAPQVLTLYELEGPEDLRYFLLSRQCFATVLRYLGVSFVVPLITHLIEALSSTATLIAERATESLKYLGLRIPLALTVQKIIHPLILQIGRAHV